MAKTLMLECETDPKIFKVLDKLVRKNGTGSFIKRFWKNLSLCCPRVEIIGTRDWKSGVLAKDLLGDQETTWRYKMP
ncbi:hypothetical protein YC2023_114480 [Brassica napus]